MRRENALPTTSFIGPLLCAVSIYVSTCNNQLGRLAARLNALLVRAELRHQKYVSQTKMEEI